MKGNGLHDIEYSLPLLSAFEPQLGTQSSSSQRDLLPVRVIREVISKYGGCECLFFSGLGLEDEFIFHVSGTSSWTEIVESLESVDTIRVRSLVEISDYVQIVMVTGSKLRAIHVEYDFTQADWIIICLTSK